MTDAARQRRRRQRAQNGLCCFKVEGNHDRLVSALLEAGRLTEAEALHHDAVERELAAILQQWADRWLK